MSFRYLTAERTQMHLWTRKRRMKFRKRWRKQHHGHNFRWFAAEFKYITCSSSMPVGQFENMILFKRTATS